MSDNASSRAARILAELRVRDEVNVVSRGLDYVTRDRMGKSGGWVG